MQKILIVKILISFFMIMFGVWPFISGASARKFVEKSHNERIDDFDSKTLELIKTLNKIEERLQK